MTTTTASLTTAPPSPRLDALGPSPGTVLGIWAHPDDEAYLSSGLMLRARLSGERVVVVTATDGELGGPSATAAARRRLARRRRRELRSSLAVLGVADHVRLGYPDGGCSTVDPQPAVHRLAELIDQVRPDTIVTFGPDGLTGHADHRAVGSWAVAAASAVGHTGQVWFPTLTPGFHRRWGGLNDRVGLWMDPSLAPTTLPEGLSATVRLTGDLLARKVAALRAHTSQTSALVDLMGEETFAQWWATEWFRDADPHATAPASHPDGGRRVAR